MSQSNPQTAPGLSAHPSVRAAFRDGGPLMVRSDAPRTLSQALVETAERFGEKGIRSIEQDGTEEFLSYAELLERSRRLLQGLRRGGLTAGSRVLLQSDGISDHFVAFWACVLGGATPVTVAVPPSYREAGGVVSKLFNIWQLLDQPLILTSRRLAGKIPEIRSVHPMEHLRVVCAEEITAEELAEIHPAEPTDVVFLQLTSGSTGVPKCIQETHQGILQHIFGSQQFNDYRSEDVSLNWLPFDHVVPSLTFHLKDLVLGCSQIHARPERILAEPLRWIDLLHTHRVTHTWSPNFGFKLVADRLRNLGDEERVWDLSSMQFFMNAGEQVTLPVIQSFLAGLAPYGVKAGMMQPAFGMAEVCTCMTYQNEFTEAGGVNRFEKSSLGGRLKDASPYDPHAVTFVDLGPPMPGVQIRITDHENRLLPEGVIGRFQIRGAVVTPGYLKNAAANAEAFVGDGWFNSGDLGFILNGRLTLTGREKEMIIVRGANFYCYEVEDMVERVPGVEPTFVASCAVADPGTGTEGLIIFCVVKPEEEPRFHEIERAIRRKLTSGLGIGPLQIVRLDRNRFPKTTSGKIQRTQLKKDFEAGKFEAALRVQSAASDSLGSEPTSETEQALARIWQSVLGQDRVGCDEHLFELGGDSLKATQIISRVRSELLAEITMADLFESAGTVRALAALVEARRTDGLPPQPAILRATRGESAPLSFPQQRMWLLDQMQPGTAIYNVVTSTRLKGELDVARLERAIDRMLERHEILRTTYQLGPDGPVQTIQPHQNQALEVVDCSRASSEEAGKWVATLAATEARAPFDLSTGPLVRIKLLRLNERESVLLVVKHQIVTDAWALKVFFRELAEMYAALEPGQAEQPGRELPIQYADFAIWQRQAFDEAFLAPQRAYWREKLEGAAPELNLPIDLPRPSGQTHDGQLEQMSLPELLSERIAEWSRERNLSLFMTLLGAYQTVLHLFSGQEDILTGAPVAGRNRMETEALLGFFVNTVVMRTRFRGDPTLESIAAQVKETALGAFAHQDIPVEQLIHELRLSHRRDRTPLFQVWFGMLDPIHGQETGRLRFEPSKYMPAAPQFELSLFITASSPRVSGLWEYKTNLFHRETIHRLMGWYEQVVRAFCENPAIRLSQLREALGASGTPAVPPRDGEGRKPGANLRGARRRAIGIQS